MRKQVAIAASLALALSLGACSGSGEKKSDEPKEEAQEQVAEEAPQEEAPKEEAPQEQTFESDLATVTYRDTQDAAGNAVVSFALANKTDRTLMVGSENLVVNDEFSVKALGGSTVPIQPGTTGAVSLAFGVSTQTTLGGTEDLKTLSGNLVLYDDGNYDNLGTIPFSVTI